MGIPVPPSQCSSLTFSPDKAKATACLRRQATTRELILTEMTARSPSWRRPVAMLLGRQLQRELWELLEMKQARQSKVVERRKRGRSCQSLASNRLLECPG